MGTKQLPHACHHTISSGGGVEDAGAGAGAGGGNGRLGTGNEEIS